MFKWIKRLAILAVVGGAIAGVCIFTGASSYVRSSGRMLKHAVKDSIPIEFELQRARDMLDDLVPELRANLKLVAAEDVAVENLGREIGSEQGRVETERGKVRSLHGSLNQQEVAYRFGGVEYTREEVVRELERRFDNLRTAEKMLESRQELLKNRKRSLAAAIKKLETTRTARTDLASQIEGLEAQFRLIQASSCDSPFSLDDSKLAQTRRVIGELKNRLQVAQRVLAQEAKFFDEIPVEETISESTVVERVAQYFDGNTTESGSAPALVADSASF